MNIKENNYINELNRLKEEIENLKRLKDGDKNSV